MVNILFDYLRQKAEAVGFVSKAYAQAVRVTRRDGDNNTVSFPAVFENGEIKQLSFDAYDSLVFFMLDGEIERKTEPGEISSEEDQITETYKAKAYFFHSGKEISDCASFAQQATHSLAKYICANNDQLETELNLQSVSIIAGSFQFLKEEIWNELHSGIELKLSEKHQLCSIAFEIEISGVESCFVNDPCELGSFTWEFSSRSSCEIIDTCLRIDRVNGSEALVLSEKGTMVPMSGGASTLGGLTNVDDSVNTASNGIYAWQVVSNAFSLIIAYSKAQIDALLAALELELKGDINALTLDQVRNVDNSISGDINANSNTIINLKAPVNPGDAMRKAEFDALESTVVKRRGPIDLSSNPNFPASEAGDRWEVTVAGKIGGASGRTLQVWDEIVAQVDSAGGDFATAGADFYFVQADVGDATESTSGTIILATDAETQAGTNATKAIVPLKLTNWWNSINLGVKINAASAATPNDSDLVATAENSVLKKITWTNVKAFLKTYFDTLYATAYYAPDTESGTTYTLAAGDVNKLQRFTSASAVSVTVPNDTNASTILVGYVFRIVQSGTGQITLTSDSGVTINHRNGLKSAGQYAVVGIEKVAANTWLVYGDTTT